ncbi:TraX family protein [Xanthomonas translucens]|uniref:TraX family protein n=1 Tax=Xanthomonas campestris pv. translucens TaxID=343 RepID=UPI001F612113|nr:TraX family protein [Xanthomonas translucens]UNU12603.1 conjugal transfer protein [Xanthomonas translucens pv. translucens]
MTSGGRELLKWLAVVLMTGDHAIKVLGLVYVPVVSEFGRVAFPVFALVMAYNLAQPGADVAKSVRRLALWGVAATPAAYLAFGQLLPLNVLLTFALAAACVLCIERRLWVALVLLLAPAPLLVDYQWSGVLLILAAWNEFKHGRGREVPFLLLMAAMGLLCLYNGNGWALLAAPLCLLAIFDPPIPRTRWAFYGYYVGHLAALGIAAIFVTRHL